MILAAFVWTSLSDMNKAYVEIMEDTIHVVDYYMGIKREKKISFSDIVNAEIVMGYSHKVRGYRWSFVAVALFTVAIACVAYLVCSNRIIKRDAKNHI